MPQPVDDKNRSAAQKSADAKPVTDGPHRPVRHKNKAASEESPAYVVAVSKREPDEAVDGPSYKYDPQELRAKARSLLKSGKIDPEQRRVLAEILGPEEEVKPKK